MTTPTTNYAFGQPTVGADADVWGALLNAIFVSIDKLMGSVTTTGSGAAYVLTTGQSLSAYATGQRFRIKASFTCNAAATINVDGLGAKNITKNGTTATVSGDIVSGVVYDLTYDGTQFQALNVVGVGAQPLDAKLSAIAALTWADDRMLDLTGTSSIAVVTYATVLSNIVAAGLGSNSFTGVQATTTAFRGPNGSAGAPGLSSTGETNSGMFFGDDGLAAYAAISAAGVEQVRFNGTGPLVQFTAPVQARIALSAETSGALTSASANKRVVCSGGVTLPASGMTAGDFILIYPAGSARTVTRPSAHAMYVNNTDSATGTTGTYNAVVAIFEASGIWTLEGNVS